jgi:alpha-methylacyl-CoA racemase
VPSSVIPSPALDGITVLDFATVGPAARASRLLSDYGARVVKIGAVPRAGGVQIDPPFYAYSAGRDTLRIQVDLKSPEGRDAFLDLAATADVVLESFRPGVVDRLGIGYAAVAEVNPTVVYCSTSGYGQTGPYAQRAGHDLNYLALGGYLDCSERAPGNKPPLPGATVADAAGGGMQAALAILAALVRRGATGEGDHLDVSIADGVVSLMGLYIDEYLATGVVPGPGHYILTGRYACYDTYRCADDRWVAVGAIEPHFYANLCRLLDCERWTDHQLDDDVQDQIRADFRAAFERKPRDEWVAELGPADTCVSAVYTVPELVDDAHVVERGLIVDAVDAAHGPFRQLRPLLAGATAVTEPVSSRPSGVTDTDAVLEAAGFDPTRITSLRQSGAIA